MANEEQLEILKSGVEEWNRWREENEGYVDLCYAKLVDTNLRKANLFGVDLSHSDLCGANLFGADLSFADLGSTFLFDADLRRANLDDAYLYGTSFNGANLSCASLGRANLRSAHLEGADLSFAELRVSDLSGAFLCEANFNGSSCGYGNLSARFDDVRGLEEVQHHGPSAISPEALEWAQGKLPEVFLKGIGFKDWEILNAKLHDPHLRPDQVVDITYEIASLRTKGPIQVNSLFISYTREDGEFASWIEGRLDKDGIRSWRDVHDMVAGPVESQIERAIGLNRTVLLVLSENSVDSDWVEMEVEMARGLQKKLQAEGHEDAHVLCPVAIDDSWKEARWPKRLMNQLLKYHVLDFSGWKTGGAVENEYSKLKAGIARYYSDFGDLSGG